MTIVTAEVTRNPAWATGASLAFAGGVTALGNMAQKTAGFRTTSAAQ